MILWISEEVPEAYQKVSYLGISSAPSLTAIAMDQLEHQKYDWIVVDCRDRLPYSTAHILMAQQLLQLAGTQLLLIGEIEIPTNSGILLSGTPEDALENIWQEHSRDSDSGPAEQPQEQPQMIHPIPLPTRPISIAVLGSEHRIGCTTQAMQLWRYFSSLRYKPVIIMDEDQLEKLTAIEDGAHENAGITVVNGISLADENADTEGFTCKIRDWGPVNEENGAAAADADLCLLTIGVKSWEVMNSAEAVSMIAESANLVIVVSFADPEMIQSANQILTQSGRKALVILADWAPNPYAPVCSNHFTVLNTLMPESKEKENGGNEPCEQPHLS